MLENIACKVSKTTAIELLKPLLPDKPPTLDGAVILAEELAKKGWYVKLDKLMDLWMKTYKKEG